MFQKYKRAVVGAFMAAGSLVAVAPAYAIDTTAVTTFISTEVTAAVTAVGLAMITLAALAVGFKWIKGGLFG